MRLAVFSDIHGNADALRRVLEDIDTQGVDSTVCLGDAVQGGAQPAQTVELLRQLDPPVVMGNADSWLVTGQASGSEPVSEQQEQVRQWSLAQLSDDDIGYIKGFKPTIPMPLEGGREILCFHGSPTSFDDLIFPETAESHLEPLFGPNPPALLTGGHTHLQQIRRFHNSIFFNPGSVGVAYDRHQPPESFKLDPWAEYAIVTCRDGQTAIEFRRLPLDPAILRATLLASGRPGAEAAAAQYD